MYFDGELFTVHVPKTGGSSLKRILTSLRDGDRRPGGGHDTLWMHSGIASSATVLVTIRCPAEWYCSLYLHATSTEHGRDQLRVWGKGFLGFEDILKGWVAPRKVPGLAGLTTLAGIAHPGVRGLPEDFDRVQHLLDSGLGFASWYWLYAMCKPTDPQWPVVGRGCGRLALIDTADIYGGVAAALNVSVSEVSKVPPQNHRYVRDTWRARPPVYQDWYTPAMLDRVREVDGALLRLVGRPDLFCRAEQPVTWLEVN